MCSVFSLILNISFKNAILDLIKYNLPREATHLKGVFKVNLLINFVKNLIWQVKTKVE